MSSEPRWSMGLGGAWAQLANATAVTVICTLFVWGWYSDRQERRNCQKLNQELLDQVEESRQAIRALARQLREQKQTGK